jgi:hypothetical protein
MSEHSRPIGLFQDHQRECGFSFHYQLHDPSHKVNSSISMISTQFGFTGTQTAQLANNVRSYKCVIVTTDIISIKRLK